MSKKSGGLLFSLLQFGALSVLGNMTWEALGLKWPDHAPSVRGKQEAPPDDTQSNPPLGAGSNPAPSGPGQAQGEKK